jgi:hypothetical protein
LEDLTRFRDSVDEALKTISYCHGAKVGKLATTFSKSMTGNLDHMFKGCKELMEAGHIQPKDIIGIASRTIAEAVVVLPLDKLVAELQQAICLWTRSSNMSQSKHEWRSICAAVIAELSETTIGNLDEATEKFSSSPFWKDPEASLLAQQVLDTVVLDALTNFPKLGFREDLTGFVEQMVPFIHEVPDEHQIVVDLRVFIGVLELGVGSADVLTQMLELGDDVDSQQAHSDTQREVLSAVASTKKLKQMIASAGPLENKAPKKFHEPAILVQKHMVTLVTELEQVNSRLAIDLHAWLVEKQLRMTITHISSIEGGLANGKHYKDEWPKSSKPSWKSVRESIQSTLGLSDVCADMEKSLDDALAVTLPAK